MSEMPPSYYALDSEPQGYLNPPGIMRSSNSIEQQLMLQLEKLWNSDQPTSIILNENCSGFTLPGFYGVIFTAGHCLTDDELQTIDYFDSNGSFQRINFNHPFGINNATVFAQDLNTDYFTDYGMIVVGNKDEVLATLQRNIASLPTAEQLRQSLSLSYQNSTPLTYITTNRNLASSTGYSTESRLAVGLTLGVFRNYVFTLQTQTTGQVAERYTEGSSGSLVEFGGTNGIVSVGSTNGNFCFNMRYNTTANKCDPNIGELSWIILDNTLSPQDIEDMAAIINRIAQMGLLGIDVKNDLNERNKFIEQVLINKSVRELNQLSIALGRSGYMLSYDHVLTQESMSEIIQKQRLQLQEEKDQARQQARESYLVFARQQAADLGKI